MLVANINDEERTSRSLGELYPGYIANVDTIEIVDVSNNQRKVFSNPKQVQEWISRVKHIEFAIDHGSGDHDRSCCQYEVVLIEKGREKLTFTPYSLGGNYYTRHDELYTVIDELYHRPKYSGMVVLQIEDKHIEIGTRDVNPEASYPSYEIILDERTVVAGRKTSVEEIKVGDFVNVWVEITTENQELAIEIEVTD